MIEMNQYRQTTRAIRRARKRNGGSLLLLPSPSSSSSSSSCCCCWSSGSDAPPRAIFRIVERFSWTRFMLLSLCLSPAPRREGAEGCKGLRHFRSFPRMVTSGAAPDLGLLRSCPDKRGRSLPLPFALLPAAHPSCCSACADKASPSTLKGAAVDDCRKPLRPLNPVLAEAIPRFWVPRPG